MSFRGKPSKGCAKCRQRKVKCDEAHPACKRCVRGGFDCVYRDQFDLFFRNQTTEVASKAQEKWRSRAKKLPNIDTSESDENSESSGSDSSRRGSSMAPNVSLIPFKDSHARHRFFFDYCIPYDPHHPYTAFLGFVPQLAQTSPEGSCLQQALAAAAYANFAGRYHSDDAKLAGAENYGKALISLSKEMSKPVTSAVAETLVAISLLGMYELTTSPVLAGRGSWVAHTNGAVALLRQGVLEMTPKQKVFSGIYHWVFTQMLISCLSRNAHPTLPLEMRDRFMLPNHHCYPLFGLMYESASVCAEWRSRLQQYRSGLPIDLNEIQRFINKAEEIDQGLEKWTETLPIEFYYEKYPTTLISCSSWLNPLLTAKGAPEVGHRYSTFGIAARWTFWRTTRLILSGNMLEMCRTMCDAPPLGFDTGVPINMHRRRKLISRMLVLGGEICEAAISHFTTSIPAHPEPETSLDVPGMRGFSLLWPLFITGMFYKWSSLQELDVNHRGDWIRRTLLFIQEELSIKKAEAFLNLIEKGFPFRARDRLLRPPTPELMHTFQDSALNLPASPYPEVAYFQHTFVENNIVTF